MGQKDAGPLKQAAARAVNAARPFYRRFPYKGPVEFFKVDARGAYSPLEPFFYNRVPKAANTTIAFTLAQHSQFRRMGARKDSIKGYFLRPSYLSRRDVDRLDREAFKFTVVRDPYSRVLSAFNSKILVRKPQWRRFRVWWGSDEVPEFADFCRYLDEGNLYVDMHWAPQSAFMLLPLDRYDFIGKVETLDTDLPHILERVFGPERVKGMARGGLTTGASDKVARAYGPREVEIVNRLYARDFEAFGYDRL